MIAPTSKAGKPKSLVLIVFSTKRKYLELDELPKFEAPESPFRTICVYKIGSSKKRKLCFRFLLVVGRRIENAKRTNIGHA